MEKAQRFGLGPVIQHTLAVTSLLLGTPLPAPSSAFTLPERLRTFPQTPLPDDAPDAKLAFRHLRLLTRPLDKLRYFAAIVFAPRVTDLEFVRVPPYLGFLYYFVRPLRLAFKWTARAPGKTRV